MVGAGRASMEEEGPLLTLFLLPKLEIERAFPNSESLPCMS
jgi:hypothetical protein